LNIDELFMVRDATGSRQSLAETASVAAWNTLQTEDTSHRSGDASRSSVHNEQAPQISRNIASGLKFVMHRVPERKLLHSLYFRCKTKNSSSSTRESSSSKSSNSHCYCNLTNFHNCVTFQRNSQRYVIYLLQVYMR
jgi:hypothetical protein